MRTRRRLKITALAVVAFGIACGASAWPYPSRTISDKQLRDVYRAKTVSEVEAILGFGPGYRNISVEHRQVMEGMVAQPHDGSFVDWAVVVSCENDPSVNHNRQLEVIRVWTDGEGQVTNVRAAVYCYNHVSPYARARMWFVRVAATLGF
ncbi:MAG: hypothetical protein U0746_12180 [Gemmataceae bacterium]